MKFFAQRRVVARNISEMTRRDATVSRLGLVRVIQALALSVPITYALERADYRRLQALLARRDHPASVMRVYRLYRAKGRACGGSSTIGSRVRGYPMQITSQAPALIERNIP